MSYSTILRGEAQTPWGESIIPAIRLRLERTVRSLSVSRVVIRTILD